MEKILKIKAFMPKNIDKRAEDLKRIQAKELLDYEEFIKEFQQNLKNIKNIKSEDSKEQLFIDLIQDCDIKTDIVEYPFIIFLFKGDKFMFEYNWKIDKIYYSYNRFWSVFESKLNMSYDTWQRFMTDQVETHFNFRPFTTDYLK